MQEQQGRMGPVIATAIVPSHLSFARWKHALQGANTRTELLLIVAAYLSRWDLQDVAHVPAGALDPIRNADELAGRALDLSQQELKVDGLRPDHAYLRELSLTLSFAAARLRFLNALHVANEKGDTRP